MDVSFRNGIATYSAVGFKSLERDLADLAKPATRKAASRRAMRTAAAPTARMMRQLAPKDEFFLSESITASTRLSPRQASLHKRMFGASRAAVEMFIGPGPDPAAHLNEFGSRHMLAQPFVRPAWDRGRHAMLNTLRKELWREIRLSVARAAIRAQRS